MGRSSGRRSLSMRCDEAGAYKRERYWALGLNQNLCRIFSVSLRGWNTSALLKPAQPQKTLP